MNNINNNSNNNVVDEENNTEDVENNVLEEIVQPQHSVLALKQYAQHLQAVQDEAARKQVEDSIERKRLVLAFNSSEIDEDDLALKLNGDKSLETVHTLEAKL